MIRNEKCPTRLRNVLAPLHANPVNRMRHHPQHQPQKRIRQQVNAIHRHDCGEHRSIQENSSWRLMKLRGKNVVGPCSNKNSHKGPEVSRRNYPALVLWPRPMLDKRVDRYCKETAEESEEREMYSSAQHCLSGVIKERSEDRHPQCAQRNQSIFDLAA